MSDYTKSVDFSAKDALTTGDPNKVVSGTEINTELANIQTSNNTKADKATPATTNNMARLDTNGNLSDSGFLFSGTGGEVTATAAELSKTSTTASQGDLDACTNFEETISATTSEVSISSGKTFDIATAGNFKIGGVAVSTVVQVAQTSDSAVATGTTVLPFDDTIPQNTEGDQYMSLSFTPKYSTSTIYIEFNGAYSSSVGNIMTVALFRDSVADALAGIPQILTINNIANSTLCFKESSPGTSAVTYKIRIGGTSAGTTTFNGTSGSRYFGGVMSSTLTITEVL